MLATAGPGLFPQLAASSLKFRAVKRRENDRRDLGPGWLLSLQQAAWELFALLAHTPEPAGFPKIALWYSCRRLCVLGSSLGGSQRGLEASGGSLVALGVGLAVGWGDLCHRLGSLRSLPSLLRRGLCRSRECRVPVAMETEVRPAGEKCYSERQ